ncbi:ABC transporter ATP-binding protein [Williamsoniiplasma somnilux]|uniref:ABC transporter ATP-binding protein n=1 Tax=Williamsoniiplasma somnilux TaxID=215578 RepID=A0A2K8P0I4_9MOLU|nr:ABC transporter ATP-binding protein [Williamsoniiplasma somnilux]ATZ18511.1 ABC transporter ATP-binding protein [Williamsoniiplasma somnilux]
MQNFIVIDNATKKYGDHIGNFNININIKKGETFAIVGPNGAGKTTLIRQILGFIKSDEGTVAINNFNSWINREEIMKFTGYVAGEISLYDDFTGIKFLKLVSKMKKDSDWQFVEKLIKHFDLDASRKIKKMSKGMKQKIAIIAATMNKPAFLVLDEPTSGLDPIMQQKFKELINKLKKEFSTTIIICSHIFEEVINFSDRVGILKKGVLIDEYNVGKTGIKELNKKFKKIFEEEGVL